MVKAIIVGFFTTFGFETSAVKEFHYETLVECRRELKDIIDKAPSEGYRVIKRSEIHVELNHDRKNKRVTAVCIP